MSQAPLNSMDFAMKFGTYSTVDLINLCNSHHQLSFLDRDDLYSLIRELGERVEDTFRADMTCKAAK